MKQVTFSGLAGRITLTAAMMAMLSGCGGIIPAGEAQGAYGQGDQRVQVGTGRDYPPAYRPPSETTSTRQPVRMASAPISRAPNPQDISCLADLDASGAQFDPIPDTYAAPGCHKLGTVQLAALSGDGTQFGLSNLGPVQCNTAKAFSGWARFGVDRAARQILKSPLARIETMGSYSCRNVAGSNRRSAHSTGNAIDVSGFVLEDGRRITLTDDWNAGTAAEREFLRVVQKSACKRFGTVLGPQYNAAHEDHFHLEGSETSFCR